jgi:hypothetical protein
MGVPKVDKKDLLLSIVAEYKQQNRLEELVELFTTAVETADSASNQCCEVPADCCHSGTVDKDALIESVLTSIKSYLGPNYLAIDPDESITIPTWSPEFCGFDERNTIHVESTDKDFITPKTLWESKELLPFVRVPLLSFLNSTVFPLK